MQHSQKCKELVEKSARQIAMWEKRWPNYCRKCNGEGQFISYYNPSPSGVSLGSGYIEDIEPCICTENSICARCGSNALNEDGSGPCQVCDWNYDDCKPYPYECTCWEDEPYFSQLMAEL